MQALITKVHNLVIDGELLKGHGGGLLAKLNQILEKIDHGKIKPAVNQLEAFKHQVSGYINSGHLTTAQGNELIEWANEIINDMTTSQ